MASGDTLIVFHPYNNEPPSSNYASLDLRNLHPVIAFGALVGDKEAVFSSIIPQNYDGGGFTVFLHYSGEIATTGDVVFQTAFERIGDQQQDVDADSFAAFESSGAIAVPGTSGLVDIISIPHTTGAQIDNILIGEKFRLKIRRDVDDTSATDTFSFNIELHAVEIRET